jgi:hypothetical protein
VYKVPKNPPLTIRFLVAGRRYKRAAPKGVKARGIVCHLVLQVGRQGRGKAPIMSLDLGHELHQFVSRRAANAGRDTKARLSCEAGAQVARKYSLRPSLGYVACPMATWLMGFGPLA